MDAIEPVRKADTGSTSVENSLVQSRSTSSVTSTSTANAMVSLRNRNPALHPTREDSPYPGNESASPPFQSLAESATNATLQLQQQINLMAQAMAMQSAVANGTGNNQNTASISAFPSMATAAVTTNPVRNAITNNETALTHGYGDRNTGVDNTLSNLLLDQYVAAAAAASSAAAFQQQQQDAVVAAAANLYPASTLINGYPTPLAAFLTSQQQQDTTISAQIQLLQQQQRDLVSLNDTNISNTNILNPHSFCPCTLQSMTAAVAATAATTAANSTCPYQQQNLSASQSQFAADRDNNNNNNEINVEPHRSFNNNNETILRQHRQISNSSYLPHQQTNANQVAIVQPISANSTGVQSHRMSRNGASLKRSNGTTTALSSNNSNTDFTTNNLRTNINDLNNNTDNNANNMGLVATTTFSTHMTSPPPLLFSPNATSIQLATGAHQEQQHESGPSRAPKLRRMATYGDDTNTIAGAGMVNNMANIQQVAVLAQLQQQQATAAFSTQASPVLALTTTPTAQQLSQSSNLQNQQLIDSNYTGLVSTAMQQPQSLQQQSFTGTTTTNALLRQQLVAPAISPGSAVASTISSVATGVEQIVAAALNAANAANALSPQALAAITNAAYSTGASTAVQCAVCAAAAACQSRLPTAAAAAVTACSCLHHHLHHCHHQLPVCTLCNSNVLHSTSVMSPSTAGRTSSRHGTGSQFSNQSVLTPVLCSSNINSSSSTSSTTTNMQLPGGTLSSNASQNVQSLHPQLQSQLQLQLQQHFLFNNNNNNNFPTSSNTQITTGSQTHQNHQNQSQQCSVNFGTSANMSSTNDTSSCGMSAASSAAAMAATHAAAHTLMNAHQQTAAAALSPSAVSAMLLNSVAAMGQQQTIQTVPAHQQQQIPSLYNLQRGATLNDAGLAAAALAQAQQNINMNSVQQTLLANRLIQQERERESANNFYQQQQQQQFRQHLQQQQRAQIEAQAVSAAAQHHLMRPLIMMPQRIPMQMAQMDLSSLVLLHHLPPDAEAALVLNGGGAAAAASAAALAHAANPHHIVANAMATAAAPEQQPVGVTLEQIKRHSQKLSYVEDPEILEQERERCTVCLCEFETGDELRGLNCGHSFHTECIDPWLQQNKKCPLCRIDMDKGAGTNAVAAAAVAGSSNTNAAAVAEAAVVLNAAAHAHASATSSTSC